MSTQGGNRAVITSNEGREKLAENISRLRTGPTEARIRAILSDLERVRENLLVLSDDIWLSIDHNNPRALDAGVQFKRIYNEKIQDFSKLADDISELVQQFTDVSVEPSAVLESDARRSPANDRITIELDRETPHNLEEDFRYKRPYGFILLGRAFKDIVTWRKLYELVCQVLGEHNPKAMSSLPDNPEFFGRQGNSCFTRDPSLLRAPLRIADGLYAEGNLSANSIGDMILRLLQVFDLKMDAIKIYLREDRDALPE